MDKTELYNHALGRLGIRPLTGSEDDRQEAVFCNRFFPLALSEVLDMGSFVCSLKRARLAKLNEKPDFGFEYAYALPGDFLHLVSMEEERAPFALEGARLLCDLECCNIVYARMISNAGELPPLVANCVVLNLAAKLATAVTNNPQLSGMFLQELYGTALPAARTADQMQKYTRRGNKDWREE